MTTITFERSVRAATGRIRDTAQTAEVQEMPAANH